jgi:hypothetical protein
MKKLILPALIAASVFSSGFVSAQEKTEAINLPGDQFSLKGALEAFKNAESPEAFEKALNVAGNDINNLDLNEDGEVDYIRVINKSEKDVQLFILQVPVTENENQDIAVIELERTGEEQAVIQIIGDEDIFGEELIIEPAEEEKEVSLFHLSSENNSGPSYGAESYAPGVVVNVWGWPHVRFVFGPRYVGYVSPWRWHHPPVWWAPRRPIVRASWHPRRDYYHNRYVIAPSHRVVYAHNMYRPMRVTSVTVYNRNRHTVTRYRTVGRKSPGYYGNRGRGHNKTVIVKRRGR